MHFSDKPESVRVDFWKPSGKWHCTEAVIWTGGYKSEEELIHDGFARSLRDHLTEEGRDTLRLSEMRATCLEPCHEHSHPISMMVEDAVLVDCRCGRTVIRGDISKKTGLCIRCSLKGKRAPTVPSAPSLALYEEEVRILRGYFRGSGLDREGEQELWDKIESFLP